MDSITSAARRGVSIKNAKMFVTTYPCHYCARHIVASGILEVQFIEPYLKSLALSLHNDAITTNAEVAKKKRKVLFKPFVGVAPKLFEKAFLKDRDLKNKLTGEMHIDEPKWGGRFSRYNSSYTMLELKLTEEIENEQY